eukprot:460872-Pleurochrysis_carterae.AAC.4
MNKRRRRAVASPGRQQHASFAAAMRKCRASWASVRLEEKQTETQKKMQTRRHQSVAQMQRCRAAAAVPCPVPGERASYRAEHAAAACAYGESYVTRAEHKQAAAWCLCSRKGADFLCERAAAVWAAGLAAAAAAAAFAPAEVAFGCSSGGEEAGAAAGAGSGLSCCRGAAVGFEVWLSSGRAARGGWRIVRWRLAGDELAVEMPSSYRLLASSSSSSVSSTGMLADRLRLLLSAALQSGFFWASLAALAAALALSASALAAALALWS